MFYREAGQFKTTYADEGGSDAVIMFAAESDATDLPALPTNVLLVTVEELASTGHDLWLAALAWGAGCVMLAAGQSVPPRSRQALQQQVDISQSLLQAMGWPARKGTSRPSPKSMVSGTCQLVLTSVRRSRFLGRP